MQAHQHLDHLSQLAKARLGVAEDLGWFAAAFAGVSAYLQWNNWLIAVAVFGVGYYALTYSYRKSAKAATDTFHQAAGLGAHSSRSSTKAFVDSQN